MGTVLTVDTLSFNRPGLPTSASCWPPWIQGCALESRPAAPTSPLPWGLHHAGPVGVDHSMELQPGPLDPSRELQPGPLGSMVVHTSGPWIHGCASSPGPAFADVQPMFADVCIRSTNVCRRLHTSGPVGVDHSMELQPGPLGSIEGTASSPLPWDRSRELHRVPAHGSMVVHHAGPWIHGCASCWPMDPWLCIESRPGVFRRSTGPVCRRLHTFNQCLPTSAYFRPGRR
jgi:hypothetical protein